MRFQRSWTTTFTRWRSTSRSTTSPYLQVAQDHARNSRWRDRSLWSLEDIVAKIDAMASAPAKRDPYKKRNAENSN
jgi:hypothetical protein